jgi:ADP-heptose:LPS heptosyltransferase
MSIFNNEITADTGHENYRIGIFRALYLGDMLCIIPAVRAVRAAYPKAEITLIGLPWQKDFAKRFRFYFDHFVEFPGWPGLPEQPVDLKTLPGFIAKMQEQKFDLVLQMQGNGAITNNMCMLWDAKKVCGLRKENDYCPDENLFPVSGDDEHEVLRFLKLTDALHLTRQGVDLEFPFAEEEIKAFAQLKHRLQLPDSYVCVHPGARDPRRRWAAENFAYTASCLAAEGYAVVLTGSEDERSLLKEVKNLIQYPVIDTVDTLGNLSLGELATLIGHSSLLVSNDTGVSHIAAALRIPSVVIFSSFSNITRWAPLDRVRHKIVPAEQAGHPKNIVDMILHTLHQNKKGTSLQTVPLLSYAH